MALLGLGLQQWLSKSPATGLAYISSQVSDEEFSCKLPHTTYITRACSTVLVN